MTISASTNRKARRAKDVRRRTGIAAAAAMTTAAALTAGISAPMNTTVVSIPNIDLAAINLNITTTGPLLRLLPLLGFNGITIPDAPIVGEIDIKLNWSDDNPQDLYNAMNAIAMVKPDGDLSTCGFSEAKLCRITPILTLNDGSVGARNALNTLWSQALGQPLPLPNGYTPMLAGQTNTLGLFLNDMFRPNGGINARFGSDSTLPNTGSAGDIKTTQVNGNFVDFNWEYSPLGDFPAVFNVLALTNTVMAALPPLVDVLTTPTLGLLDQIAVTAGVGGPTYAPGDSQGVGGLLSSVVAVLLGGEPELSRQLFATLTTKHMPLLAPIELPTALFNQVLKALKSPYLIGNPLADVLQNPLKILVNIAYPDVLTPTDLKNDPKLVEAGYGAYDRTFAQQEIKFGSVDPLTPAEHKQVGADVWNAFTDSVKAEFKKPFWGVLVPNPAPTPGAAVAPAAVAPAPAAAAVSVEAPVVEPVSVPPAPKVTLPEAPDSAPVPEASTKAPVLPSQRAGAAAKPKAGSDTPGHRGPAHSAAGSDN